MEEPAAGQRQDIPYPPYGPVAPAGQPAPPTMADPAGGHMDPRDPMARRRGGEALFWTVLLWLDIGWLVLNTVAGIVTGIILVTQPDSDYARSVQRAIEGQDAAALYLDVLLTFAAFGAIPFLWAWRTRLGGWPAAKEYLRLHQPLKGLGLGVAFGLGLVVAILVLLTVVDSVACGVTGRHFEEPGGPNPVTDAITKHLDWTTIILIALAAGIGEEILFRGVVQRQLGMWWQAVLFSVAHAANASILQLAITLPVGVFFGWWIRRGGSLYTTIAAHVTYDFVLLAIAFYASQRLDPAAELPAAGAC